ncbi:MAG: SDR family NAD(P)-dependent oxidoreductase [Lysobacterales bacterium]|jgi:NAD(P)-dependent dehydrogenase (short-subunit alcohol dehydrogenase family)|nr:MAG: SDR family NAD(P)-dependent oxidoreductase [Xanthomonadales bacterium]
MLGSLPDGSHVLVQGASRGIGLEFVRQCAADARIATVVAACRRPMEASDLQALAARDPRVRPVALDVTDEASIRSAAAEVARIVPRLHLVVQCAGLLHDAARGITPEKRLADVHADALLASFAVNAWGPLLVAKHFERLLDHRERAIHASISARVGSIGDNRLGGWYAYRGSKAAQNMFTKTLAIEWSRTRRNVICVALHPGTTDTDLSNPFQGNVAPERLFSSERTVRQLLGVIDRLQPTDTGRFLAWDGTEIPW